MKVIKRDGREQDFKIDKIKTSVMRASDDAGEPLNVSDIDNVATNIMKTLNSMNKEKFSADEVSETVLDELNKSGFQHIAEAYSTK